MDFSIICNILNRKNLPKLIHDSILGSLSNFNYLTKDLIPSTFQCNIVEEDNGILFITWNNFTHSKSFLLAISGEPEHEDDPLLGIPIIILYVNVGAPFMVCRENPTNEEILEFVKIFINETSSY